MQNEPTGEKTPKTKRALQKTRQPKIDSIGALVLGAGIIAVLGVAYLAYQRFYAPAPSDVPADIAAPMEIASQNETAEAAPVFEKNAPSESALQGSWQTSFETGKAYLQMKSGAFQLIYALAPEGTYRKYQRGSYTYKDGVLTLAPRREMGEPKAGAGVSYSPLTWRDYDLLVGRDTHSGDILWLPKREGTRRDQTHTLFLVTGTEGAIRWKKAK